MRKGQERRVGMERSKRRFMENDERGIRKREDIKYQKIIHKKE